MKQKAVAREMSDKRTGELMHMGTAGGLLGGLSAHKWKMG